MDEHLVNDHLGKEQGQQRKELEEERRQYHFVAPVLEYRGDKPGDVEGTILYSQACAFVQSSRLPLHVATNSSFMRRFAASPADLERAPSPCTFAKTTCLLPSVRRAIAGSGVALVRPMKWKYKTGLEADMFAARNNAFVFSEWPDSPN